MYQPRGDGRLRISATAVRPGAAGEFAALRTVASSLVAPPNDAFASVTMTDVRAEHHIEFDTSGVPDLEFEPNYAVYEASNPAGWITTPDGRVRLVAIGVSLPAPGASSVSPGHQPWTYYRPDDLSPMALEQLPKGARHEHGWHSGPLPNYRFVFAFDNVTHPDVIGYAFHDARTKARLSRRYSYGTNETSAYVEASIAAWHGPAVVVCMKLAHGPMVEHDLPAIAGSVWRHGPLHIEVLGPVEHTLGGSHGWNDDTHYMGYEPNQPLAGPHGVVIGILPRRNIGGLDLKLVDVDGEVGPAHWSGTMIRCVGYKTRSDLIAAIRCRWRPHFKKLIWRVPALPRIAPNKPGMTDLTQVRVPYVDFDDERDFRRFLAASLQCDISYALHRRFNPDPGVFPVTLENKTLGEILDVYLDNVAIEADHTIRLDEATMILAVDETWFARTLGKVKAFIDRNF